MLTSLFETESEKKINTYNYQILLTFLHFIEKCNPYHITIHTQKVSISVSLETHGYPKQLTKKFNKPIT